jgi:hypothetical protein
MIRTFTRASVLLGILVTASPALAQEKGHPAGERPRLGVGVSLTTFDFAAASAASPVATAADVYVMVDLGQLRVEPSLGISSYSIEGGDKARSLNLGVGALFQVKPSRTVAVYVGPRLFLDFVAVKDNAGFSDSGTDFTLAGVLGAEWFADPRFSIGAEARLGFTIGGQLSDAGNLLRPAFSRFGTSGLLFFRFYL